VGSNTISRPTSESLVLEPHPYFGLDFFSAVLCCTIKYIFTNINQPLEKSKIINIAKSFTVADGERGLNG